MCSHQLGAAHIAYHNILVGVHDSTSELMTGIQPAATNLSMQALCLLTVTAPLQVPQPALGISVEPNRIQPLAIASYRDALDTQVYADRLSRCSAVPMHDLHRETQPPVTHRILCEAALLPTNAIQTLALKHPKGLAAEPQSAASSPEAPTLERNPAQTAPRTLADPPSQFPPSSNTAPLCVFDADLLNRVRADALEIRTRACSEIAQVESREPFAFSVGTRRRKQRRFVTEVEHLVYFDSSRIEP